MQSFLDKCKLKDQHGDNPAVNEDILPATPEMKTYKAIDFASVWAGPSFDINQWNAGSSFVAVGLTVAQTVLPVTIGSALAGTVITVMGLSGAFYGTGFPANTRFVFGTGGAKAVIVLRGIVGVIWYAVEAYYVATMLKICFRCIFGHRFNDWTPAVPESLGTTAQLFLSFMLIWAIIFPLALVHPSKLKIYFNIRSILGPAGYFALFGWIVHLGLTKPGESFVGFSNLQPTPLTGTALSWAFVSGINSVFGTCAPQITSVSDITRYAVRPSAAGWPQGVAFFVTKVVSTMMSIFAASFLKFRYNQETAIWNTWDQLDYLLDQNWSAKSRFGVFVIAFCFGYSSTMTNAYANTVPFGADFASLFPRYLSIIRAQIIIAVLCPAIVPWRLFTTGVGFLTFLGSYTFFMAAATGPLAVDFFVVRRGNIHVPSLYNMDKNAIYGFNNRLRTNWRAYVAYICGMALVLPGLVEAYMPSKVGSPASRMYSTGWLLSCACSGLVYYICNLLSPVPILPPGHEELAKSLKFGELAHNPSLLSEASQTATDSESIEKKGSGSA